MQGFLSKSKGSRRSSFSGLGRSKWDRRWFVLPPGSSTLCYYKTQADSAAPPDPSRSVDCRGSHVTVTGAECGFSVVAAGRTLSLRADSDASVNAWVAALVAAGAVLHEPEAAWDAPPALTSMAHTNSSNRIMLPVPSAIGPGEQFTASVPGAANFNVRVPPALPRTASGRGQIEVMMPPTEAPTQQHADFISSGGTQQGVRLERGPSGDADPEAAWALCKRFHVTLEKPAGARLGMGLAPNKEGWLTIIEITPGGVAASCGKLLLGDMLLAIDGQRATSLDATVAAFSVLDGTVELEVQRVDTQDGLEALVEQVSLQNAEAERESRDLREAVTASQDDDMMDYALNRSVSLAVKTESLVTSQDEALKQAMAASIESSLPSVQESSQLEAALHQSEREMVTPRGARAESNAVRAFEEEFSGTAGRAEGETAAASRSRCNTATAPCGEAGRSRCNTAASATGGEEEGVYEAQTHFVLMQLSRPSLVACFEEDSEEEEEDPDLAIMRTQSKFV